MALGGWDVRSGDLGDFRGWGGEMQVRVVRGDGGEGLGAGGSGGVLEFGRLHDVG